MAAIAIEHLAKVSEVQLVCGWEFAELLVLEECRSLLEGDEVSKDAELPKGGRACGRETDYKRRASGPVQLAFPIASPFHAWDEEDPSVSQ